MAKYLWWVLALFLGAAGVGLFWQTMSDGFPAHSHPTGLLGVFLAHMGQFKALLAALWCLMATGLAQKASGRPLPVVCFYAVLVCALLALIPYLFTRASDRTVLLLWSVTLTAAAIWAARRAPA
ncbi:hypothetical protein E3E11_03065 [Oecophyllibacter saccharovorans]|uniref:hypothetical protein n=1 Tax=Oecophyllibacter saccharovorans TaxID=2558360 RepID=UPI001144A12A|nr:hypothetical protein [Oecophyllibacter saccharovorans]QDH15015.1 hypothetical protein E3E11_03065 [Oecophyllibacter saccharovorans]